MHGPSYVVIPEDLRNLCSISCVMAAGPSCLAAGPSRGPLSPTDPPTSSPFIAL